MKTVSAWALAGVLVAAAVLPQPARAQSAQLNPPAARISDRAIQADQQVYERLQARIKGLNDRGRPLRDYHLAKAQCWLDASFHEYTRNDRSAFPQAALAESEQLVVGMEQGVTPLPTETPLVAGAARVRPDLWERAGTLRRHAGWSCAQARAACAEVELVHAGHELNQQQWRHARPYVQIAEDLLGQAQALADACPLPTPPAPAPAPPPAPPALVPQPAPAEPAARAVPPPVRERPPELVAQVLFDFDGHREADIRPFSVLQVEQLVQRIQREPLEVVAVRLSGHADRLNRTGRSDYNQQLSERRVQTVREMLVRLGLDARLVSTTASGDTQQVNDCEVRFQRPSELQECLLPNRRVEIVVQVKGR